MANEGKPNPNLGGIGLSYALMFFGSTGVLSFLIFCVVRERFKSVYAPRSDLKRNQPPELPTTLFGWIPVVWYAEESLILETVGLDGVILLRFLKNSLFLFSALSILGILMIAPINFYSGNNADRKLDEAAALQMLTIENVPQGSAFLRFHLLFTWIVSIISLGFLISYYRSHAQAKLSTDESILKNTRMNQIEYRSLICYGIPKEIRHEVDLASFMNDLGLGRVENVVICRKWKRLREAVASRAYYLQQLERIYTQVLHGKERTLFGFRLTRVDGERPTDAYQDQDTMESSPLFSRRRFSSSVGDPSAVEIKAYMNFVDPRRRPTHKTGFMGLTGDTVDSTDYFFEKYLESNHLVEELRRSTERSAPTGIAFVTFESPESAQIASQILLAKKPFMLLAKMAPEPRDVYWPNITADASIVKFFKSLTANLILILIVLFSTVIVVAFIAPLITLPDLDLDNWPILRDIFQAFGKEAKKFLQEVIGVLLLNTFTSSLPSLLMLLSEFQGLEAISWIEQSVFSKLFGYLLFNYLLFTVGKTVWDVIISNENRSLNLIELLGNTIPQSSPTMMSWLILQGMAMNPAQLLQAAPLVMTFMFRSVPWARASPRDTNNAYYPSLLSSLNFGYAYSIPTVVWVIGLTYSCISPLILPFAALFFGLSYLVHKYLLLYVHIPKYESGGAISTMAVRRCLVGLVIMQLTMMGVLALKYGGPISKQLRIEEMQLSEVTSSGIDQPGWSKYAQMVIAVLPLPFITFAVFWWFKEGYERLVKLIPIEIIGKVSRGLSRCENAPRHTRDILVRSGTELGTELQESSNISDRNHRLSNATNSVGENGEEYQTIASLATDAFMEDIAALEPPMSRVPGVLDAPIGEDGDLTMHSYCHPALIGRLPTAWLPGSQSSRLKEARIEQLRSQRELLRRIINRQQYAAGQQYAAAMNGEDPTSEAHISQNSWFGKIMSFFDGISAWAHFLTSS